MTDAIPYIVTGNWKMHKTIGEALLFVEQLIPMIKNSSSKVYLAVPYTMIFPLTEKVTKEDSEHSVPLKIGAQNMNDATEGAFTGEIAGKMLTDAGAQFVLLGHAERRLIYHETNEFINRKLQRAIQVGLQPVLCIGETKSEHEENKTEEVLRTQLTECLKGLSSEQLKNLILAYEPVWAIGHGEVAHADVIEKSHGFCRQLLKELLGDEIGSQLPIQYGGSVNPENVSALLRLSDVNGLLVGGASLSLDSFSQIIDDSNKIEQPE